MSLLLEGLRAALEYANVRAFTHVVQRGEIPKEYRHKPEAYRVLFGGTLIDDLSHHPRIAVMSPWGWTAAAGAYQAMCAIPGKVKTDTWDNFCRAMGSTPDEMPFDPDTQDAFCVWCIKRRGALQDVIHGEFDKAVEKCSYEWASFPPGRYGQPQVTMEELRATYMEFGGTFALGELIHAEQPAAPIEERDMSGIPPRVEMETPMPGEPSFDWSSLAKVGGAIASIFNPAVGIAITALSPLLQEKITKTVSKHSSDPKVAAEIGQQLTGAIMSTAKQLTGKTDDLEAVAAMRRDPAMVAAVERAVTNKLDELAPFLDKLHQISKDEWAAATEGRNAAAERAAKDRYDSAPILVWYAVASTGLILLALFILLGIQMWLSNDHKPDTTLIALVGPLLGLAFKALMELYAYRFDGTKQSSAKDALIGELSARRPQ